MKGSAVIEYAINNDLHPSFMASFHEVSKECIAGFQILYIRTANTVSGSMLIFPIPLFQDFSSILYDSSKMRIDVSVILRIIFMIGRRNK